MFGRKKLWIGAILLVTLVVTGVGLASAGSPDVPTAPQPWAARVRRPARFPIARDMLKAITDKLGMSVSDLTKEMRSGKSILVIADEKGTNKDALVQAIVDSQEKRLQKAVDDGRITADQKTWIEQKLKDRAGSFLDRQGVGKLASPAFTKDEWNAIADKLGMSTGELRKELRGKTLAAIAAEKSVSLDDLSKAVTDARKASLDKMVKDGNITQAQADAALSSFQDHLNKCVENGEGLSCGWGARAFFDKVVKGREKRAFRERMRVPKAQGMWGYQPAPQWYPGFGQGQPGMQPMPRNPWGWSQTAPPQGWQPAPQWRPRFGQGWNAPNARGYMRPVPRQR